MRNSLPLLLLIVVQLASCSSQVPAPAEQPAEHHQPLVLVYGRPPNFSRDGRFGATATVRYTVNVDGSTSDIQVLENTHEQYAKAVVSAVSTWRFEPPTKGGQPVARRVKQHFEYKPEEFHGRGRPDTGLPDRRGPVEPQQ